MSQEELLKQNIREQRELYATSVRITQASNALWEGIAKELRMPKVSVLEMLIRERATALRLIVVDKPEFSLDPEQVRQALQDGTTFHRIVAERLREYDERVAQQVRPAVIKVTEEV